MQKIVIVDYGMGNINSIKNMLRYLGQQSVLSNKADDILAADRLILPGVGNFGAAMENIEKLDLRRILNQAVTEKHKPILGICLGMQLLLSHSEEGNADGFGWIKGQVRKFQFDTAEYKIPHMGWNYVDIHKMSGLVQNIGQDSRYYFVHSYYAECADRKDCIATTDYGITFDSIIGHGNVMGTQFHPEKSHKYGMEILKNFLEEA